MSTAPGVVLLHLTETVQRCVYCVRNGRTRHLTKHTSPPSGSEAHSPQSGTEEARRDEAPTSHLQINFSYAALSIEARDQAILQQGPGLSRCELPSYAPVPCSKCIHCTLRRTGQTPRYDVWGVRRHRPEWSAVRCCAAWRMTKVRRDLTLARWVRYYTEYDTGYSVHAGSILCDWPSSRSIGTT